MRDKKTGLVDDLNDLKAFAEAMRPGELTVISGASGVGKTTLALVAMPTQEALVLYESQGGES